MQKRCAYCKAFKDFDNFKNTGKHCIARSYFKLCADCRKKQRSYMIAYERPQRGSKQPYKQRPTIYRDPSDNYSDEFEVEPHIYYDPNMVTCYVDTDDLLFVGDYHLSEFKFQTLDEAREFRDWAFGLLKAKI